MYLLTIESKKQNKWTSKKKKNGIIQRVFWWLPDGWVVRGMGENGKGIRKYKLVVIQQLRGCKVPQGIE